MSVLNYKIDKIVTPRFEIKKTDSLDRLRLSLSFGFKVSVEEGIVCCVSKYEYISGEEKVMELELECYFKVEGSSFNSLIDGDVLTIKTEILQYLASIAVGTARGELHARCALANSKLQDSVLPPVNLTKIITTPAEFYI